jgi:Transposase IS4
MISENAWSSLTIGWLQTSQCRRGAHKSPKQEAYPIYPTLFVNQNHWVRHLLLIVVFRYFFTHICLGTDFKNIACSVTGCIVGLELQRGKEGMRVGKYCDSLGATAACTLRLTELPLPLDGDGSSGIMGDAWFGSVKAATALSKKGYKAILQVKTGHGLFPKKFIDEALKDAPGGVWIVLESVNQDVPLVAIGYRYSTRTTLFFVATTDSGTTSKGNPYEMKYTDDWGNVHVRYVDRPEIISKFFERSNMIDKHNHVRQSDLKNVG